MTGERRDPSIWRHLFLVRHGESTANEINRFAGDIDAPLTLLGRAQAARAGRGWSNGDLDHVYVSPLTRAQQTARILLGSSNPSSFGTSGVVTDERLRERHFGDFTLRNKDTLQRRIGLRRYEAALYHDDAEPPGAESFGAFRARILEFIKDEIYPLLCAGRRVLIIAHKYVLELLSRLVLRLRESTGFDLRLPNAKIIGGADLGRYVHRESPFANAVNDAIVVHHAAILAGAALFGLLVNISEVLPAPPQWILVFLLFVAAAVSLARISFSDSSRPTEARLISTWRLMLRFAVLPWIVALGLAIPGPISAILPSDYMTAISLLLATPAAVTAVVLSRTSGGMILPSALAILTSTAMSVVNTILLLSFFGQSDLIVQAVLFLAVSSGTVVLPLLAVHVARNRHPIAVARAAENHGALAVLALALFVVMSFQQIDLESFYPSGLVACAIGIALRIFATQISRRESLYGVDDYFVMSYPNIFLVIIMASLMHNETLLNLATWFLVPMFMMAPIDNLLIRRLRRAQSDQSLMSYLGIDGHELGDQPEAPVARMKRATSTSAP